MAEAGSERLRKGSFSFFEVTLQQLEALADTRRRERDTDLQKQALHIGTLFISIAGEPDRDGRYGHLSAEDLAAQLRPWIVLGADWLERHGHPVQPGSPSTAFSSLLALLAQTVSGPPLGATTPALVGATTAEKAEKEPGREAVIKGDVLSSLNLDDSPIL